ncbi:MAG TPA: GGDEF domain-containing protein [Kineosporiaceae bacterium]|nr:GGDEF domain-containing protein [Kineosporiaceae bacterium]
MIVMFLATSMSRRAVAVYGGSCVTAAACTIAALPGAPVMVGFRVVVLTIALGFPIGFFLVLRGELDEALRVARVLATKDTLTGLLNRRGLEEAFPLIASSTVRDAQYLAALVCDLDHFKKINDTHGHDTADEVLALVGKAVSMRTRPGDVLVRLGGEEIAVIAAVKHGEEARLLAERLRQDVQDACRRWSATRSVGIALVADIPPDEYATALSRLLADADKRLYEAKQMGRNRVVGPDPSGPSVPRQGREVLSEAPVPRTSISGRTASPAPPDAAEVPPTSPGGNRPWGPMGTSAGT